jgi:hypothetical protein
MNFRERTQGIFASLQEQGKRPAADSSSDRHGQSSAHRHQQALFRRNQYPESRLWEMAWSPMATRIGVGSGVCIWCQARHRQRHPVRIFPSAALRATHWGIAQCLAGVRVKLEGQILTYHQEQQQQLQQVPTKVEVCAGADETFFEQMVLVLLDLSSGYIFVEAQAKDRGYQTWQALVQQALASR